MNKNPQTDMFREQPSDIGLSDVLVALNCLDPASESIKKAIINSLGFKWENIELPSSPPKNTVLPSSVLNTQTEKTKETFSAAETIYPKDSSEVIPLNPLYFEEPQTLQQIDFPEIDLNNSEVLSQTKIDLHFDKPAYTALFNQKWFQGIMSSMLATLTPTGRIDLKRIEKNISTLSPITDLPYVYRATLNKGVQVLLDTSVAMQPFWRDESELINSLYRLLDVHKTRVFEFELKLNPFPQIIWQSGTSEKLLEEVPILLVTNFGATVNAELTKIRECEDLVRLLEQARIKRCEVMALIPTSEEKFPQDIKELIPFAFTWDSQTSPQAVHKTKRK